jgi:hypothetical protein
MSRGKTITIKAHLNKRLKPIILPDGLPAYPLYIWITCRSQTTKFKYFGSNLEPKFYTEAEFYDKFSRIDINGEKVRWLLKQDIDYLLFSDHKETLKLSKGFWDIYFLYNKVVFLLELVDVFTLKKFSIKKLPDILKAQHELEGSFKESLSNLLMNAVLDSEYAILFDIIDWKGQNPTIIKNMLESLIRKFNLPDLKVSDNNFPFNTIEDLLLKIKEIKGNLNADTLVFDLAGLSNKIKLSQRDTINIKVTNDALNFYKSAIKMLKG